MSAVYPPEFDTTNQPASKLLLKTVGVAVAVVIAGLWLRSRPLLPAQAQEGRSSASTASSAGSFGTVVFDPREMTQFRALAAGHVRRSMLVSDSQRVHVGDIVAEIDVPTWTEALRRYAALPDTAPRATERHALLALGIPESSVNDVEVTHVVPTSFALQAPADGVAMGSRLRPGTDFAPGQVLLQVNGTRSVWINAPLPRSLATTLPLGTRLNVRTKDTPTGTSYTVRLHSVASAPMAGQALYEAHFELDNTRAGLLPGSSVELIH